MNCIASLFVSLIALSRPSLPLLRTTSCSLPIDTHLAHSTNLDRIEYPATGRTLAGVIGAMAAVVRWTWDRTQAGWSAIAGRVSDRADALVAMYEQAHEQPRAGGAHGGAGATVDFPAFWSFVGSRYTVALILCTGLANRIIAIVPPNLQIPYRSSAKTRALVRSPAILLLARSCILILGMLAKLSGDQGVQAYYSVKAGNLLSQDSSLTHANVLWSCFVAACVAVACESFVRALDRDIAATIPINLFSLALLLHYHSLPSQDPLVPPSRQVYILLLLTLLEILCLHLVAIPAWRARLPVTAFFAIVSRGAMLHFWLNSGPGAHASLMPAIQSLGRILPEVFFAGSSLIFIVLRALVQLITEGRLNMDIFGHASALPHRDDDFLVALIKYGTATLETTAMKGLNNEVSMLSHPATTYVELHAGSSSASSAGTLGTGQVFAAHPAYDRSQRYISADPWNNEVRLVKPVSDGSNEVDPLSKNASMRKEIWRFCKALHLLWQVYIIGYVASKTGVGRLAQGDSKVARGLRWVGVSPERVEQAQRRREGQLQRSQEAQEKQKVEMDQDQDDLDDPDYMPIDEPDVDESGSEESDSDSDDEGDVTRQLMRAQSPAGGNLVARARSPYSREATPLDSQLEEVRSLLNEPEQQEILPVLIAHLQAEVGQQSSSPLTRRRYRAITLGSPNGRLDPNDMALTTAIAARRQAAAGGSPTRSSDEHWDDSTFRAASTCVVCCAEQRSIVLWPCRCLALCNDCRAELAARSNSQGGSSICPCCRTPIQGYSRILIP